jgi:hypothetical protein
MRTHYHSAQTTAQKSRLAHTGQRGKPDSLPTQDEPEGRS